MASRKKVSLAAIGREIRNAQRGIRAARRGLTIAQRRRLDAKIRKLDRHRSQIMAMCRTWNPL